mmetsp:Transcript_2844/g.7370  ORF Transcript_2844/g.7370 Transcript_2844/m.7370 type:complete len:160 (-) Transcript_2844:107-586(-)
MAGLLARTIGRAAGRSSVASRSFSTPGFEGRQNPVYPTTWNKWFPHEPIPSTPKIGPYQVPVEEKTVYHFCTCGESASQPWCEAPGARCGKMADFVPKVHIPGSTKSEHFCGCKKAPTELCNGTCIILYADLFPFQVCAIAFGSAFTFCGVFLTWMMHP